MRAKSQPQEDDRLESRVRWRGEDQGEDQGETKKDVSLAHSDISPASVKTGWRVIAVVSAQEIYGAQTY